MPCCPKLLYLSLDALLKTQNDDVRLNCIAFLTVLTQRGFFQASHANGMRTLASNADTSLQIPNSTDGCHLYTLFTEAIKGPLLSSDEQVQIGILDLIFYYLSCEENPEKKIQLLVESSIGDYVFEVLRLAGFRDPVVNSCLRVLDILSTAEQAFRQTLAVGFTTLIPILQCVAEVPYHPCQSQILKLIWSCVSNFLGVATTSQCEELVLILTKMLRRHREGEFGMLSETFTIICSIFVSMIKHPSYHDLLKLIIGVQEASELAILSSLTVSGMNSNQILQSLYLLKEAYAYGHEDHSTNNSNKGKLRRSIVDVCKTHILPWLVTAINETDDEEVILGVLETFHFILYQVSDNLARELAETLISSSWFSFSFESLGLFPTERMRWRVYLMISSLVDILFGNDSGQPIREAVSHLPSDPSDFLFLLGQKSYRDVLLSSCQSATLFILYCSSLYDERLADDKLVLASLEQYILVNSFNLRCGSTDSLTIFLLVNLYGLYRGLAKMSYQISYSPEAERIFFQLLTEHEWDLACAPIHSISLKWLFQQEKICISLLTHQILKLCRIYSSNNIPGIICGKSGRVLDVQAIAQLVVSGDNYAAKVFVCLLEELVNEKSQESDLLSLLNLVEHIIGILPDTSDQLCLNGIAKAMRILYYDSGPNFSPEVYSDSLIIIFNLLSSVHSESVADGDAWVTVTTKLTDQLIFRGDMVSFNHEELLILGILCLILYHSTNGALMEASKTILLNTPLTSMMCTIIHQACSSGPTLHDDDEKTISGTILLHVILLQYFSMRSVHAVLPGTIDWSSFLDKSNTMPVLPLLRSHCHELCMLIHYGCPLVKVVASYCLLEVFTRLSDQRQRQHEDFKCSSVYLKSVMAVLEGLLFYNDSRVAVNCGQCLSMIFEWEMVRSGTKKVAEKNKWCRLIVEELAMSLAVPSLVSKSCSNNHKASIYMAIALLKQEKVPGWMRSVFDDACISGILQNLSGSCLSTELILLFRELLNVGFLTAEHIGSLNRVLQECRKLMYHENVEVDCEEVCPGKAAAVRDDTSRITDHLVHLMSYSSRINRGGASGSKQLLEEIETFLRASAEEGNG
ncbi:protein PRD1 isoform X2 [Punica granatum]|nr:protein PRD1 isoform X2 [Punica granatum]